MPRPSLRIELFGTLTVRYGDEAVSKFRTRKDAELLAYLALHSDHVHTREELIELLWPKTKPEVGLSRLRQALTGIRRALEKLGVSTEDFLLADRPTVRLDSTLIRVDVLDFKAALADAQNALDSSEKTAWLLQAVGLYRDELLKSFYQNWILTERERLAEQHLSALRQLMPLLTEAGRWEQAIEFGQRAVEGDPFHEETRCELMRVYAATGQPAAVEKQYRELHRVLKQELGEKPSEAARHLAVRLYQEAKRRSEEAFAWRELPKCAGNGADTLPDRPEAEVSRNGHTPPVVPQRRAPSLLWLALALLALAWYALRKRPILLPENTLPPVPPRVAQSPMPSKADGPFALPPLRLQYSATPIRHSPRPPLRRLIAARPSAPPAFRPEKPPIASPRYRLIILPSLTNEGSGASRINDAGQVVGRVFYASGYNRAVRWENDKAHDLGTINTCYSVAADINSIGQIVGNVGGGAFRLAPNQTLLLQRDDNGPLPSPTYLQARGINNRGQIVGLSDTDPEFSHPRAFLYSEGKITDLGTLGGKSSEAYKINSAGQIVGKAEDASGICRACLWQGNKAKDISNGLKWGSQANDINEQRWVVGMAQDEHGSWRAFFWSPETGRIGIGTLGGLRSEARGINRKGEVVGWSDTPGGVEHAILWTKQQGIRDLNALIEPGSGWILKCANAVNNKGEIVGVATQDGWQRAFRLAPIDAAIAKSRTARASTPGPRAPSSRRLVLR